MIRNLPVDAARLGLVAATASAQPAAEWVELSDGSRKPSGNQARARTEDGSVGALLWTLDLLAPGEDRAEVVSVQIASNDEPKVQQFQPVELADLVARVSLDRKTNQPRLYWSATGLRNGRPAPSKGHEGG